MADATASPPPPRTDSRVHYFFTINIPLAGVAVLFVILRLITRTLILNAFGWDDALMIVGTLVTITSTVLECYQTRYGLGRHIEWVLAKDPALLISFFRVMYALILLYIVSCFFIKVSIILFYRRLGHERKYIRAVWVLVAFNFVILITMGFPAAFGCRPIAFFWDNTIPGGKCIQQQKLYTVNSALNIIMDFAVLTLPMPMVWKAQMALKRRLTIIGMFAIGGFVCIASVIRVTKLFSPAGAADITWAAVESHTWIELYCGIIAAAIPTLKPLFKICFGKTSESTRPSYPTYGSGKGSSTGPKKSWRYSQTQEVSLNAIRANGQISTPKRQNKIYEPAVSRSEEELIEGKTPAELAIWRTTEFKVETENQRSGVVGKQPHSQP